jgi:hypothetical protein
MIHRNAAKYIESHYSANLRLFYQSLSYHYSCSRGHRPLAFKYTLKSADQAISKGAYRNGLALLDNAVKLSRYSKGEIGKLIEVVNRGLRDMQRKERQKHKGHGGDNESVASNNYSLDGSDESLSERSNVPGHADPKLIKDYEKLKAILQSDVLNRDKKKPKQPLKRLQTHKEQQESQLSHPPSPASSPQDGQGLKIDIDAVGGQSNLNTNDSQNPNTASARGQDSTDSDRGRFTDSAFIAMVNALDHEYGDILSDPQISSHSRNNRQHTDWALSYAERSSNHNSTNYNSNTESGPAPTPAPRGDVFYVCSCNVS